MPEPADCRLFMIAPGVMAILAVKFLGDDFERAKDPDKCGSHKFSGHLWVFDIRGAALRAANQGRSDIGICGFPFNHETLPLLEVGVVQHNFSVRLWTRHETDLLQGGLVVNVRAYARVLEAAF